MPLSVRPSESVFSKQVNLKVREAMLVFVCMILLLVEMINMKYSRFGVNQNEETNTRLNIQNPLNSAPAHKRSRAG